MRLILSSSLGGALDVVFKDASRQKLSKVLQSRYARESIPRGTWTYNSHVVHNRGDLST